jgi:cytochrome c-type biogenesis protein CcmH/NrfG
MAGPADRIGALQKELAGNASSQRFYQLGELLRRDGRLAEAIHVLRSGLAFHPRYVAAWVSLGRAQLAEGDLPQAVAALEQSIELDPQNPVSWRLLGETRLAEGDRMAALDALQYALQLAPGDDVLEAAVQSLAEETEAEARSRVRAESAPDELPTPPEPLPAELQPGFAVPGPGEPQVTPPPPELLIATPAAAAPPTAAEVSSTRELTPEFAFAETPAEPVAVGPAVIALPAAASAEPESTAATPYVIALPPAPAVAPEPGPVPAPASRPEPPAEPPAGPATVTLARLYLRQQELPTAAAILARVLDREPDNLEARELLALVRDMMEPLPEPAAPPSVHQRKIAALQQWLASLTLGRARV